MSWKLRPSVHASGTKRRQYLDRSLSLAVHHEHQELSSSSMSIATTRNVNGCYSSLSKNSGVSLFFALLLVCVTAPQCCDSCQFPAQWTGSWFQKGVPEPIRIFNGTISDKGDCVAVEGDKFLIESRAERCYRCVVIHEKHVNVLQYKETFCSTSINELDSLCSEINGDAPLYSVFRLNTPPVACPFHGPFTFTYSTGRGECNHPVSSVESCTVDSRLLFRFQACADIKGSESRVEELVCLAVWKEGSTRYFVGKLEHKMAMTDEDKLRCFVYEREKDHPGVLLSQSGDATCDGLLLATEGSRTMKLTKVNHQHAKCAFPLWMTTHKHWRTLDGTQKYEFGHRNNTFRVVNATDEEMELRVACTHEDSSSEDLVQLVVHSTSGCKSGYACMRIHKRANHVIEVQFGAQIGKQNEACLPYNFDPRTATFLTLTTGVPETGVCPLTGIYSMDGAHPQLVPIISPEASHIHFSNDHRVSSGMGEVMGSTAGLTSATNRCNAKSIVTAGCESADKIKFLAECATDSRTKAFQCHGSWEENGTFFLIASAIDSRKRYCMTFTENEKFMQFSGSQDSCIRNVPLARDFITFNVTTKGMCSSTNTASALHINSWTVILFLLTSVLATLANLRLQSSAKFNR